MINGSDMKTVEILKLKLRRTIIWMYQGRVSKFVRISLSYDNQWEIIYLNQTNSITRILLLFNIQHGELQVVIYQIWFGSTHRPGNLRFYGMNIIHNEYSTCSISTDDTLQTLKPYPINRFRRLEDDASFSAYEQASFKSLIRYQGWIGISASPFCAFYSTFNKYWMIHILKY